MFSLNQLKRYYINSPLWLKNLYASIPFDIRNGSEYRKWREFLNKEINIEEYEILKMKEAVSYAYENSNYYNNLFKKLDIHPHDINSKKDFLQLPLIDKGIVRKNFNDFVVKSYPKKKIVRSITGGSSGSPMEYIQSKNVWYKEVAYYMDFFNKYDATPSDLKAAFRGGSFKNTDKKIYWMFNPVNNEMIFSSSHINANTIRDYVNKLNQVKPRFFHGFPSSMLFLMHYMKAKNLSFDFKIKAIFLVSEAFVEEDIEQLYIYFNCPIAATYGHSERLVFGRSSGDFISGYQIDKRYGLFELIDHKDKVINSNNIRGEIVGTGFDNYAMPLLRYKTNDFTEYDDFNNNMINLIESNRNQLYIDCNDSSRIAFSALIKASEMLEMGIVKYQIIQSKPGICQLLIIPEKKFNERLLRDNLNKKINGRLKFIIKITDKFFLTNRGKCQLLVKEY